MWPEIIDAESAKHDPAYKQWHLLGVKAWPMMVFVHDERCLEELNKRGGWAPSFISIAYYNCPACDLVLFIVCGSCGASVGPWKREPWADASAEWKLWACSEECAVMTTVQGVANG